MAGTMAVATDVLWGWPDGGEYPYRIVTITCTHHTDNSFSVTSAGITGLTNGDLNDGHWGLVGFETKPLGTAPTDGTDLTIKNELGADLLGGNGENAVDATTVVHANAGFTNSDDETIFPYPIHDVLTFATATNSVASANFTLKLYLKLIK